jgi:hypothetical protein
MKTLEWRIAKRCELLFGKGAKPHLFWHYSEPSILERMAKPDMLQKVLDGGFGTHVLFKPVYVGDATVGVPAIDGHLVFHRPHRIRSCVRYIHDIRGKLLFYVAPHVLRDQGMAAQEIVTEMVRLCREYGADGFYCDGLEFGHSLEETKYALVRLRGSGLEIVGHASSTPHYGKTDWAPVRLLENLDGLLWGEGNRDGMATKAAAIVTLRQMAHTAVAPRLRVMYKPATHTYYYDNPAELYPVLVELGFAAFVPEKDVDLFWQHYYPVWQARCAEYRADPDAFVRRRAEEWIQ